MDGKLLYPDQSFKIIGAALEVHRIIGCGFTEPLYQQAFAEELRLRDIPFVREREYHVTYKGVELPKEFQPDFVCYDEIIVELKAVSAFEDAHYAQVYNYLKATGMKLALLINFGQTSLQYKRIPASTKWNKYPDEP